MSGLGGVSIRVGDGPFTKENSLDLAQKDSTGDLPGAPESQLGGSQLWWDHGVPPLRPRSDLDGARTGGGRPGAGHFIEKYM